MSGARSECDMGRWVRQATPFYWGLKCHSARVRAGVIPSRLHRRFGARVQMITRQSDGMSGVVGDYDTDSASDSDTDIGVDLGEFQPMNELSFSQMGNLPSVAAVPRWGSDAFAPGPADDLEGLGPPAAPRTCDGTRCGQEPVPCRNCEQGLGQGTALGPVSEDDSWHGVSLLTGALKPADPRAPSGGTSYSREYGLSREHSTGSSSANTGSVASAAR